MSIPPAPPFWGEKPRRDVGGLFLMIAALPGLLLAWQVCDRHFLAGTGPFWEAPRGIVGGGLVDMSISLSGYYFYLGDTWHLPLFHTALLGPPTGGNILLTDSLPLLAMLGKMLAGLGLGDINLFGVWTTICLVLNGVALAGLVRALGHGSLAGALAGGAIGVSMPFFLARWGHLALFGQFEIILAWVLHVRLIRARETSLPAWFAAAGALSVLALGTNPYILAMVLAVLAAGLAQIFVDQRRQRAVILVGMACLAAILAVLVWLCGFLNLPIAQGERFFGVYGMNLASPLTPQFSLLFSAAGAMDATGGQYEGLAWPGLGVWLLVITAFAPGAGRVGAGRVGAVLWRYRMAILLLVLLFLFSLSQRVYFGGWLLFVVPLPDFVLDGAELFRGSGRFIWPVGYAVAAAAIATVGLRFGRAGAALLVGAAVLQWVDVIPLRTAIAAHIAAPERAPLDAPAWRALIARHAAVSVQPSPHCLSPIGATAFGLRVQAQLQLLAGKEHRAIVAPLTARPWPDCAAEWRAAGNDEPEPALLRVYLPGFAGFDQVGMVARERASCRVGPRLIVCAAPGIVPDAALISIKEDHP